MICKKEGEKENEIVTDKGEDESDLFNEQNLIQNYPEEVFEEENDVREEEHTLKAAVKAVELINKEKEPKNEVDSYEARAIKVINDVRKDPSKYSNFVKENKKFIFEEYHKVVNKDTFVEEDFSYTVYKHKVKVKLNKGKERFDEVAKILRETEPMNPLKEKRNISIPLPTIEESEDKAYIRNKVNEIRKDYNINVYFKDNIKNPEVAVLLMIIDDNTGPSVGKKRSAILNPAFKYISITSGFVKNKFLAFYSFSK